MVCELSSEIYMLDASADGRILGSVSTLPDGYSGENGCAAIRIKRGGRNIYASNRGHGSIAAYRVGDDGMLSLVGIAGTNGRTPRDFNIFGSYMVVANQDSDLLQVMKIDPDDGALSLVEESLDVISPVCIASFKH